MNKKKVRRKQKISSLSHIAELILETQHLVNQIKQPHISLYETWLGRIRRLNQSFRMFHAVHKVQTDNDQTVSGK